MSKVFIEESTLTAIGNAIRSKEGSTALIAPLDMASKITNLPSGGGLPEVEPLVLTGNQSYGCTGVMAGFYIDNFGDTISTVDVASTAFMFSKNTTKKIPFQINCKHTSYQDISNMFTDCVNLTEVPKVNNAYPSSVGNLFQNCQHLRTIPDDFGNDWNWSRMHSYQYASVTGVFNMCYSLRKIPAQFLENIWNNATSSYSLTYNNLCSNCYVLDEIRGVPVPSNVKFTSNGFSSFLTGSNLHRVKEVIFSMNEDGTPKTAEWANQTIVAYGMGYGERNTMLYDNRLFKYNSGITLEDEVYDDASYQALKDSPNWWTGKAAYARYGHDSMVNTINSLPDTSAFLATNGGTNTIKFNTAMAVNTDGGANALTAEEIAVATAKGWTVTFV